MSKRVRHFCLVFLAQAGCLVVGLWMQHHYVASSTVWAIEDEVWSDIEVQAGKLFSYLDRVTPPSSGADYGTFEGVATVIKSHPADVGDVTIVDPQWRVVLPANDRGPGGGAQALKGAAVDWLPESDASVELSEPQRGRLTLPGGPHIAIARALGDGRGYVLIHYPVAAIEARSAALTRWHPAIGVMTFVWICAPLSVAVYMILARFHDEVDRERSRSAIDALRKTQNLVRTRDAVIFGLAKLAESRDPETGDHLERISVYSTTLASALRRHPKFHSEVTPAFVKLIGISSALHDIGKVGVEDRILSKPGPLTSEERVHMQRHAAIGGECLREMEQRLGGSNFLEMAREIAFAHHEKWDGTGYPKGLVGTAIPLAARIVAIVDVYDALSSRRVYKDAFPHEKCVAIIRSDAGKRFDPDLVDVWLTVEPEFRSIAGQYTSDAACQGSAYESVELEADLSTKREDEVPCTVSGGAGGGTA